VSEAKIVAKQNGRLTTDWCFHPSGSRQALFPYFSRKEPADFANPDRYLLIAGRMVGHGVRLDYWRAQQRVAHSHGWKSRHGRSQSHVAWMAGGGGNIAFWSPSTKSA